MIKVRISNRQIQDISRQLQLDNGQTQALNRQLLQNMLTATGAMTKAMNQKAETMEHLKLVNARTEWPVLELEATHATIQKY